MMEQIVKEVSPVEKPIIAKESCPKKAKKDRPKGSIALPDWLEYIFKLFLEWSVADLLKLCILCKR